MKLTKLYNELTNKHTNRESSINKHYKEKAEQGQINTDHQNFRVNESLKSNRFLGELNQNFEVSNNTQSNMSLENIKIIGVTGSKGKSTVAYLTHKYLEHIGKKSVLYSSIEIDSKASNKASKQACETSITNESIILDILEEASVYQAEYVVLEINESAIAQGLIKDIPFSIRALTNIEKSNSEEFMDSKIYVENKKSFFRNIPTEDRCVSIFGLTGSFTRDDFNELLSLSDNEIITYGSKYICENRNADYTNIDFLLKTNSDKKLETLDGLRFSIKIRNSKEIHVETGIMGTFNALNITLVAAILDALGILKTVEFSDFLQGVNIPGRNEVIKTNPVVETSYSHNLNEIEISESISMELDIASSYGHTITDIADGSGKIYKSVNYTLDNLERVEEEVHSQLGTYEYEYLGSTNKLLKVKKNDAIIKTFNYVENRLRLFNDTIVSYDNYGNIIRLKNNTITYNDRNLMDSYGQNQYAYNHQNVRFKKQHENGYSLYYLDGSKILAEYKYDLNDNLIHKYHYYYNALGIAGIEYNGKKYNYLTDGQGNISKVFFEGRMIGEYNYDSFGNDEINYLFPDDETERQLLRDNPFRWKSYYKDIETGFYLVNTASGSRYYDPEIGRFIVSEFDIINGEDILDNPVRVSQNYHNCYSNLQLYPSYDSYYSDNGNELKWWQWFVSGTQLGLGIGLMFVPGAQGIGAGLMVGGGIGLISNMLDPRIGQFIGGAGSIANGGGAISTGRSLLAFGPIGQTLGVGLMLIGAGTIIFGGNEIAASVTGDNYIQQWTGMSDSAYQGSYLGLNIASGVGQIAGNIGMRYVSNKILNSIANDPSTITNYSLSQIKTYGRYTNR